MVSAAGEMDERLRSLSDTANKETEGMIDGNVGTIIYGIMGREWT